MSTTASPYRSSPTKRARRTRAEIDNIKRHIAAVLLSDPPMTIRQLFYQLVSLGVIAKTEQEYKGTVVRLAAEMRRTGELDFRLIADNTRWMRKPKTYSSLEAMLQRTAQTYRRAVWDNQDAYVEVWLEKDALAGVLYPVTSAWDVPLMVTRGYPSLSFLHSAAEEIAAEDRPTFLYHLGDHDPSGIDIPRTVEEGIRELAPDAEITFERIAVLPHQIEEFGLQTRPTKSTDARSRKFQGESVEVDAIPASTLREMVEWHICMHIDDGAYEQLKAVEAAERETLERMAQGGVA
jgi:hypothetical protein